MAAVVTLSGCCPCKHLSDSSVTTDSVRFETHAVIVERIDTAYVELPIEVVKNVTKDTISVVETRYAISTATISDGFLWHEISTKDEPVEVRYVTRTEYRDSIQYRDHIVDVIKKVEGTAKLTKWQKIQKNGFWVLLLVWLSYVSYRILKRRWMRS